MPFVGYRAKRHGPESGIMPVYMESEQQIYASTHVHALVGVPSAARAHELARLPAWKPSECRLDEVNSTKEQTR
ncbi:unnamed protein product [Fusarium graminearum]|uniref:Chromosome 1, complete genome n=1 Tax=Gibberella zeae (strain ATCC MYA-4620 / CBS 123657 / FGSC 9075 / NRRL 31084 / PH-1) TaxID=229533 RepID=A0A098D3E8_GIBZE|nr:unnamed protein product [Fusarium graminearum]CZS76224.1 unnamed protein product [Fusarium graminearum]